MNKEAVLHIPMSSYAHGINEARLVIRLRTAKNDLSECTLFYGDTACRKNPIDFYPVQMSAVASDEFFDYYEAEFDSRFHRVYYYFELNDGKEKVYYYSDFFTDKLAEDRSEYYKLPFIRREDIAAVPEWVKNAVIYNIFPDSFASSHMKIDLKARECALEDGKCTHSRLGGTIDGIAQNVDYLRALGINCIYINPIFTAGEYHKYDTIDYFHIDPCFGSNEAFGRMVDVMHKNGIRVIIDGVFNHCGWNFFAFEDVVKYGSKSRYADWFYNLEFPVVRPADPKEIPNYECFAYERLMPKLNTSNPEVMEYLISVGTYWVREFGIDGWRLDVASEVNNDFWREFRKAVKAVNPECFIIGEVWENASYWLDGSMFDSAMNYDFRKHCCSFFADKSIDAAQFDARVTNMRMRYRKGLMPGQLNLLDSHDVPRFLSICGSDEELWQQAVVFQFMFVGIPSVFYGDEQGIEGIKELDYRAPMRWDRQQDKFALYGRLTQLRREYADILSGCEYTTISAKTGSRLYMFERGDAIKGKLIVGFNTGDEPQPAKTDKAVCEVLFSRGYENGVLAPGGFFIIKG